MTTTDRVVVESVGEPPAAHGSSADESAFPALMSSANRFRPLLIASGLYLALAVMLWWNVWTGHPASATTCGCGDSSLFTWFLAWPAYAIRHGLNPLYSTALFHPTGVNLLSNTAEVGIGIALTPVTWLFGPIATLNVALTLSPFLSAVAMFVLLRRWVSWAPAAFVGGLLYGFSPFVLISLTDAHLMLGMAFVPPLMVACLDELFVRQQRRPVITGVTLGLLTAIQFLIGSEVLVIVIISVGIGAVLVTLYCLRHPELVRQRVAYARVALTAAAITAVVLLAYPVWFALAGPAHLSGSIWGPTSLISYGGNNLKQYLLPAHVAPTISEVSRRFGGYQAPIPSGQYFGLGLFVVLIVGLLVWRRDRRLWLFGLVAAISVPMSMGLQFHGWTLWRLFVRLPLMENVIPSRFLLITYLAAAVMLGVIVDHGYQAVRRWREEAVGGRDRSDPGTGGAEARWAGAAAGALLAALALVPIAAYFAEGIPFTATPVVLPQWYRSVAPHLTGRHVILSFPVPFELQSAMTWQAVDGMHYSMVGGGGPSGLPSRAGKEQLGQSYVGDFSISGNGQIVTPVEVVAVRQALDGWGVTMVVVPDPAHLPLYEQVQDLRSVAVLMTAATGQPPIHQEGAWVWRRVNRAGPAVIPSAADLVACVTGPAVSGQASIDLAAACVLTTRSAGA
ncbi:MAG TPA: hypothetical protein VGY51_13365 [Acidimicrobiales bacterium]|nr:hypothetical protein [Acidimicrobiales bacterium]